MKMKEENEKADLKLNVQKAKIMTTNLTTLWQIDEENVETVSDFFFGGGAPKSIRMVSAATKLIDACSLEEQL